MKIWENWGTSECVLVKIVHTKMCDYVCSWSIAEGGKEVTIRKPFLVFCQQVGLVIAPSASLWKNCNSFAKLASVSKIPATCGRCSVSVPHSLSYWFSHFKCILCTKFTSYFLLFLFLPTTFFFGIASPSGTQYWEGNLHAGEQRFYNLNFSATYFIQKSVFGTFSMGNEPKPAVCCTLL